MNLCSTTPYSFFNRLVPIGVAGNVPELIKPDPTPGLDKFAEKSGCCSTNPAHGRTRHNYFQIIDPISRHYPLIVIEQAVSDSRSIH